ncbi:hypothetical protein GCM10009558_090840 [Virgisporangium aurantiacum]
MHDQDTYARAPAYTGAHDADDGSSKAAVAAETAMETAKDEARNVAGTAKEQAGAVVGEARSQVQRIASQAKVQATDRVRGQHNQLVDRLRGLSDEFAEMGRDGDSPGKALVSDLGRRGQRVADFLADRGPEGVVSELTDFARRRPFAFLAGAVAAGFLVGRLGKNVWKAQQEQSASPATDTRTQATRLAEADTASYSVPPTTPAGTAAPVVADTYTERVVTEPVYVEPVVADPRVVEAFPPAESPVTPATPPP